MKIHKRKVKYMGGEGIGENEGGGEFNHDIV
jgi:hypothetical protein